MISEAIEDVGEAASIKYIHWGDLSIICVTILRFKEKMTNICTTTLITISYCLVNTVIVWWEWIES